MPKASLSKGRRSKRRHDPLAVQILEADTVERAAALKAERRGVTGDVAHDSDDADSVDEYLPEKLSRKILTEARAQQAEVDAEDAFGNSNRVHFADGTSTGSAAAAGRTRISLRSKHDDDAEEDEFGEGLRIDDEGEYIEVEADEADEALIRRFMNEDAGPRRTLADIIMDKLSQKQEGDAENATQDALAQDKTMPEEEEPSRIAGMDPKVVKIYREVGSFLKHYKSGKLPKVFKILPGLSNWEDLLYLTSPESWSPHAVYAATRIFASNLDPARAQRFYNNILLPAVQDDIAENKKLNYHLYMALKKALYKPAAFYKGILLPLCASGTCTLKEAKVVSSVIIRVSVPQIHSAAALLKLAQMRYSGAQSVFIAALINKKYTLPYRVIDALVDHFAAFTKIDGAMPVIWHQSLLVFSQRYKQDISAEQKEKIKLVLKAHSHYAITPEIRRELFGAAIPRRTGGLASRQGDIAMM